MKARIYMKRKMFSALIAATACAVAAAAPVSAVSAGSIALDTAAYEIAVCISLDQLDRMATTPPFMTVIIR